MQLVHAQGKVGPSDTGHQHDSLTMEQSQPEVPPPRSLTGHCTVLRAAQGGGRVAEGTTRIFASTQKQFRDSPSR